MEDTVAQSPMVSVVIAAYGMPDYLNQAVASVLAQSFSDYEIIVVDDCSGEDVTSRYSLPDSARLICHEKRFGAAAATRNTGIRAARGKYVAFLDQDDLWLKDKLAVQVKALEGDPKAGLAFCHYTAVDEALNPVSEQRKVRRRVRDPLRQMIRGCFIRTPSTVLLRRDVLEECGLFDESIIGASDWDLYLRIARDHSFAAIPEPLVLYRMHPEQLHRRIRMMRSAATRIFEKTLAWAKAERPELVSTVRRAYCRFIRKNAEYDLAHEHDAQGTVEQLRQAMSLWPWSPKTYFVLLRAALHARLSHTEAKQSEE